MVESGRVPGKGRIRASIEKLSRGVPEKGSNLCKYRKMVEFGRVPEKGESVQLSKNNLGEYRKRVESL